MTEQWKGCKSVCVKVFRQHTVFDSVQLQATVLSGRSGTGIDSKDAPSLARTSDGRHNSRASSAAPSIPGLHPAPPTSIRELYSEWCVSVRMHAQASALSAVPPALAQRASLSAKALCSSNSAATAFKGPKPVMKAVPGHEGLLEVTRDCPSMFGDRLWLDQLNLTRCCVVKVLN